MDVQKKHWVTVKQIPMLYPETFPLRTLRWHLKNRDKNGLSACVCKIGRIILIDLDKFEAWIDGHQEKLEGP